ncbi:MAG: glycosyltransferase, partial [Bacteroidales bacterium]
TALSGDELQHYLLQIGATELYSHIILPGFVSWKDLPWWYSGAVAFLYVSLREGFGIPVLESMACGTPVLTSSISSMPEVAGPNGLLVDPFMPDQIADWLLRLETDEQLRETQSRYGLERATRFSWRKSAGKVLDLYNQL